MEGQTGKIYGRDCIAIWKLYDYHQLWLETEYIQENVEEKIKPIYIYSHSIYILAIAWAVEQQTPDKPERGDGLTCFCEQAMQIWF